MSLFRFQDRTFTFYLFAGCLYITGGALNILAHLQENAIITKVKLQVSYNRSSCRVCCSRWMPGPLNMNAFKKKQQMYHKLTLTNFQAPDGAASGIGGCLGHTYNSKKENIKFYMPSRFQNLHQISMVSIVDLIFFNMLTKFCQVQETFRCISMWVINAVHSHHGLLTI